MRKPLIRLLSILSLSAVPIIHANDIEPSKEFYSVVYAPRPVVLDGDLSEWSGVPVLADPRFAIPKGSGGNANPNYVLFEEYNGGTWTGPDDHTSAVQITHDTENIYFGFVVTDDYHENAANSAWNGDSVQLMIANATRDQQVALYNYALGGVEEAIGDVIVMHEAGPAVDANCACPTEAVITRNPTTKKTTYEIKLPKASLGLTSLKGGPQFGLGMAINDGDAGPGQNGQKGWGGLGAHAIVFGKTPSETAQVTLSKGNDIEPGKEYYTALRSTNTITVDGLLTEWSGVPVLADPRFAIPKFSGTNENPNYVLFEQYNGGTWTGPDDQTSAVQITYDANNVYFAFVVTDDYHENAANSAWNGDSVQLMIANAARDQQIALYNYALGGVEEGIGDVIIMHEAGPATDPLCACDTQAVITRDATAKKTYYEIRLPAASLGLTELSVGTKFGLGMAINDGDAGPGQNGQKGWGGLGAHSIVFGKTPSETAEVTLGTTVSGADRFFNDTATTEIYTFSFRANDKGQSIVNAASAKLTIDGQVVALVASPKSGDATDFTYTRATQWAAGNHTYQIEISDSQGATVVETGSFNYQPLPVLVASQKASAVTQAQPGFQWNMYQNEFMLSTSLADGEAALAGRDIPNIGMLANLANPQAINIAAGVGVESDSKVKFRIPTTINVSQFFGDFTGNFTPDDGMPGLPGLFGFDDGIVAEIITFVELPAGLVTMGVNSEDGFRTQAGYLNNMADATLMAEFDGARGPSDTIFRFIVDSAGIYPFRTLWMAADGGASVEWFSVNSEGTKVLLNDVANGGFRTFAAGTIPDKPVITIFTLAAAKANGQVQITWTEPGVTLQQSSNLTTWTDVTATSPFTPTAGAGSVVFYRLKK